MRPFDPRLLTQVPATRRPVVALGGIGVVQGLATIALAFVVTNLVVAVVEGREVLTPAKWESWHVHQPCMTAGTEASTWR